MDVVPEPGPQPASVEPPAGGVSERVADNTTLLQNDEESFALAPVDATVLKGTVKNRLYSNKQSEVIIILWNQIYHHRFDSNIEWYESYELN